MASKYNFHNIKEGATITYTFRKLKLLGTTHEAFRRAANRAGMNVEKDDFNKVFLITKKKEDERNK